MACLPCMLSYSWIFQKLLEEAPAVRDTPYGALVADYAGKDYEKACRDWAAFAEKFPDYKTVIEQTAAQSAFPKE